MISEDDKKMLRGLLEARQQHDEAKAAEQAAKGEKERIEAEVYERFDDSGFTGTLKVDLGEPWGTVAFRQRETYYARIIDPDAAAEYYEQRAMMDEVSAPKFVMARLNEEVREALESSEGKIPPGLDYYANRGMTVTRQKD